MKYGKTFRISVDTKPFGITWYSIHCDQCGDGAVKTDMAHFQEFVEKHTWWHNRETEEKKS